MNPDPVVEVVKDSPKWLCCTVTKVNADNLAILNWYLCEKEEELFDYLMNDQKNGANIDTEVSFVLAPGKAYGDHEALMDFLERHGTNPDEFEAM